MEAHRFHKSSFRPAMVMGAERKPMLMLILICVALAFTSMNWVATIIAAVLWVLIHPLLAWMGTIDPQMVGVYFRSQKYQGYIPPHTSPFREHVGYRIPSADASWKFWRR